MKIALAEVPLFTFRAISGELGGLLILLAAVITGRSIKIPKSVILPVIGLSFVTTTCWFVLSAVGVMAIGSGRATLIAYTMPVWSFIFGIIILKDKPPAIR
jgi:drug/metabolite transporter (DMT)-like permease